MPAPKLLRLAYICHAVANKRQSSASKNKACGNKRTREETELSEDASEELSDDYDSDCEEQLSALHEHTEAIRRSARTWTMSASAQEAFSQWDMQD